MNRHVQNIPINIYESEVLVNLKWLRGASRYNNGGTIHKDKYILRLIMNRANDNKHYGNLISKKNDRYQGLAAIQADE